MTRQVLAAVGELAGPVHIDPRPQETPWTTPLDEDYDHTTYNPAQVTDYFAAASQAALVLAALGPLRGRSTPVNAWWGTFDLAVGLFSGQAIDPPSNDFIMRNSANAQQIEVGWWPGDTRYPRAAFFAFAFPRPTASTKPRCRRPGRAGTPSWANTCSTGTTSAAPADPRHAAVEFGLSAIRHACVVCGWDPALAASAEGVPPPLT